MQENTGQIMFDVNILKFEENIDYRSNNTAAKTLQVTDSGWPFPETYYKSIDSTVRVSGFFPKLI